MLIYIIAATLGVSAISLIGVAALPIGSKRHQSLHYFVSFATGALLGFAFFDLLPEALASGADSRLVLKIVLAGILLFFIIEQFIHYHHCRCRADETRRGKSHLIVNNLVGDGIHNFIDGAIIAGAFLVSAPLGAATTMAVALHEIPQEVADFSILLYGGLSRARALGFNLLSGMASVLGGIMAFVLADRIANLAPWLLAVAAGNFIYLSMADLIPELSEERQAGRVWRQICWVGVGLGLIYGLTVFLPG